MVASTGGSTANMTGRSLEDFVQRFIENQGYEESRSKDFFSELPNLTNKAYAKQVLIGKNIYNRDRKVDFILYPPEIRRLPAQP